MDVYSLQEKTLILCENTIIYIYMCVCVCVYTYMSKCACMYNVLCTSVRLVSRLRGTQSEGWILVEVNNVYGSICEDGFDDQDATVLCRMMGYVSGLYEVSQLFPQQYRNLQLVRTVTVFFNLLLFHSHSLLYLFRFNNHLL